MKKTIVGIVTATLALTALPGMASAAPWQNIDARQDRLYSRIEQGVRSGQLTRPEARRLRERFVDLKQLENRYRRTGGRLDMRERTDLNRRFDALSSQIRRDRQDRQYRR
jgi:hypothetical protein